MIKYIDTLDTPGLAVFATLTEAQLRNRLDPENGIFIAESPKVIRVALDAGLERLPSYARSDISRVMPPI